MAPEIICNKVDFPEPLPPSITNLSPELMVRLMFLKIHSFPNFFPMSFNCMFRLVLGIKQIASSLLFAMTNKLKLNSFYNTVFTTSDEIDNLVSDFGFRHFCFNNFKCFGNGVIVNKNSTVNIFDFLNFFFCKSSSG